MKSSARIEKLEDLFVWRKAKDLTTEIYRATGKGPFAKDYPLRNQIRRASISISSNIAEGFGRYNVGEFANFLSIASGSTTEVKSQVHIARELGYVDSKEADAIIESCNEITRMIAGLRRKAKK
jgi:four helix bundle protein